MSEISITVVVCTWNRAELLDGCLAAMSRMQVSPSIDWKVLVVDNGSKDHTQGVVARHARKLPLTSVIERKQGLSNARNRAIDECDSDYILWTDDDVRVPESWVENYANAALEFGNPAVMGGSIVPDFGGHSPEWLRVGWRRVANAYAVREAPGHGVQISRSHQPFGANYATLTAVQKRFKYDPNLGRSGKAMLSGEEEAVIASILDHGLPGVWLGNVGVLHKIEPFRQRLSYLRSYFAGHGEVDRRYQLQASPEQQGNVPRWMIRALFTQYLTYLRKRHLGRGVDWIDSYVKFAFTLGEWRAWRE
ncbi:MAG: glycosyltransferase [Pseudomonadota bacterium]